MVRATPRGLGDLGAMTDAQLRSDVLGNWHKLNGAIAAGGASEADLARLLALELARGREARPNFLDKLRGALWASRARASREALKRVALDVAEGRVPKFEDLNAAGLPDPLAFGVRESVLFTQKIGG